MIKYAGKKKLLIARKYKYLWENTGIYSLSCCESWQHQHFKCCVHV